MGVMWFLGTLLSFLNFAYPKGFWCFGELAHCIILGVLLLGAHVEIWFAPFWVVLLVLILLKSVSHSVFMAQSAIAGPVVVLNQRVK
jgi:hypothetical protein